MRTLGFTSTERIGRDLVGRLCLIHPLSVGLSFSSEHTNRLFAGVIPHTKGQPSAIDFTYVLRKSQTCERPILIRFLSKRLTLFILRCRVYHCMIPHLPPLFVYKIVQLFAFL